MPGIQNRFTIYDAMERAGKFADNPANQDARDKTGQSLYKGAVQYPRMLYHPKGKTKIVARAEAVATPFGPTMNNEQKALVTVIVASAEEEKTYLEQGWFRHPADSINAGLTDEDRANGMTAPPKSSQQRLNELEESHAAALAELEELRKLKATGKLAAPTDDEDEVA